MAALTTDKGRETRLGTPAMLALSETIYPVAASQKIFQGALVVLDGGFAKEAATVHGHFVCIGIADGKVSKGQNTVSASTADNTSGAAGDILVKVISGVIELTNDTGAGIALADTMAGLPCYAKDDDTVSADSDVGNRATAGIFLALDAVSSKPLVAVGLSPQRFWIESYLANADLSALQYTLVKLVNDTGKAEVASATAGTDVVIGILLNAPTSGQTARVLMRGPSPCKVEAGGFTAADAVKAGAAGAGLTAGAATYFVGFALETGTSGQTKMVLVQPGVLKA
jgi:hypothetical protein